MVPIPEFPDFESFNVWLEKKCFEEFDKTSARREKTIGESFLEEIDFLLPLLRDDYEARRIELRHANSLSLVRFDCNDYSVPSQHAHKEFTVVGGIDGVVETPFIATETSDDGAGMRGDRLALREGERRSPGLSLAIIGTGTPGPGGEGSGASIEIGSIPEHKNAGELRFQGAAVDQQDARERTDARRIRRRRMNVAA
jgi:hypothetical protein